MTRMGHKLRGFLRHGLGRGDYAFPFETGVFEVEKKGQLQTGHCKVSEHLRDMVFIKGGNHLWVHKHQVIDKHVWDESADRVSLIGHGILPLSHYVTPA